ncbi:hypothetical protein M404DRAFT_992303 [Pisolithus tinctorius Marx 270]|uniref:Uncharacterized protein n=1 Tax=Pisolithus tinctorius Marx 270 TaxID=870435 RepID=A0A0C3PXB4_PISTI|nr:hypothetical protein M404DRAFT_992303 [Pisolithus tinctorius Marx 270]
MFGRQRSYPRYLCVVPRNRPGTLKENGVDFSDIWICDGETSFRHFCDSVGASTTLFRPNPHHTEDCG